MFASKTPRDLNHDPMPYQVWSTPEPGESYCCGVRVLEPHFTGTSYTVLAPRDYYDHVQHSAQNPILVEFRAHMEFTEWEAFDDWVKEVGGAGAGGVAMPPGLIIRATPEQITHARAVLTRLQAVDWAAWRAPRLDPKPYYVEESDEGQPDGGRYTVAAVNESAGVDDWGGTVYNLARWAPRPGYSQNREDYA